METTNQPVIHISHPNIIKVYWNSQVQSQLTLVHQALCTGLRLVPLVGGCGVGLSGWVAGWPPFVTGHCSLACPPPSYLMFFSFHLFQRTKKQILPLITHYNNTNIQISRILRTHWHIIQDDPTVNWLWHRPPILATKRNKNLKDFLVHTNLVISTSPKP